MFHHIATGHTMTSSHRHNAHQGSAAHGTAALICIALSAFVTGCSSLGAVSSSLGQVNPVSWITPYRIDVIQGNFISKEQVDALKAGMPRAQVKDILGTPLVTSVFHADRWDYVFTLRRQGIASQMFKYTVFFKGDQLERFEGDVMPSEAEFIASLINTRKLGKVPALEATEAQLKASEKPSTSEASPASASRTPAASTTDPIQPVAYPPLERPKL
jgi:outer membrane protein assembly factor BamE